MKLWCWVWSRGKKRWIALFSRLCRLFGDSSWVCEICFLFLFSTCFKQYCIDACSNSVDVVINWKPKWNLRFPWYITWWFLCSSVLLLVPHSFILCQHHLVLCFHFLLSLTRLSWSFLFLLFLLKADSSTLAHTCRIPQLQACSWAAVSLLIRS